MRKKHIRTMMFTAVVAVPIIFYQVGQQILSRRKQTPSKSQAEPTSPKRIVIWPKQTAESISGHAVSNEATDEASPDEASPDEASPNEASPNEASSEIAATSEAQETISENARYIASTLQKRFHKPDCRWAAQIAVENRVYLTGQEEAEQRGYIPCGTCKPGA